MRPERLNSLFAEAGSLKGVGPGLARPLEKLGLTRVKDFAYHLPDRFVLRRAGADLTIVAGSIMLHRALEAAEKLAKLAPVTAVMAHRYREIAVAAREEFGDTRVSASDRTRLREAIIARLSVGTPFSMLRMGDGEVYAFENRCSHRGALIGGQGFQRR